MFDLHPAFINVEFMHASLRYRLETEEGVDVLSIDNAAARASQIAKIKAVRESRDNAAVKSALDALTACAGDENSTDNLLDLGIKAARLRATVGEISDALEAKWGRAQILSETITGAYASEYGPDDELDAAMQVLKEFEEKAGRRPRLMVAKMGQDGHDRGAKVIASAFADLGFDVDVAPLFQTPGEVAQMAVDADVHAVGVSSQAAGHKTLVPELINKLKDMGRNDIIVVCGGVIPPQDYDFLYDVGVKSIFGPGQCHIMVRHTCVCMEDFDAVCCRYSNPPSSNQSDEGHRSPFARLC